MRRNRLTDKFEREIAKRGAQLSKPIHQRIKGLIKSLEPVVVVTELTMGMGGWHFKTKPFRVTTDEGETINVSDFEFDELWR